MSFKTTDSAIRLQRNLCVSSGCKLSSEVICRHCREQYCHLCFLCHRKHLIEDMEAILRQMLFNRKQGVSDVSSFIDKQAQDAHEQAKNLVNDVIGRIVQASQHIHAYIDNRRLAKLSRLEECLAKFDKDVELLKSKLSRGVFLPAETMLDLRKKYAYNMFDTVSLSSTMKIQSDSDATLHNSKEFFENYRFYNELIHLRQKWTFLQAALTTVYFPSSKDISLNKILTFLEYRHDRVLENYHEYLSNNEKVKGTPLKSLEELLKELSFLSKNQLPKEIDNFTYVNELLIKNSNEPMVDDDLIESDSGHCESNHKIRSTSVSSWNIDYNEENPKKFE